MQVHASAHRELPIAFTVLEGDPKTQAEQLYALFADDLETASQFFGGLVGHMARMSLPILPRRVSPWIDKAFFAVYGRSLIENFDLETRKAFAHIAPLLPVKYTTEDLIRHHSSLDLMAAAAAFSHRMDLSFSAPAACSSLAAFGEASVDGKLRVGRNFDFPPYREGVPKAALVLERPKKGIPHISVYPAPGYLPGITAINREGIIVSVLMNFPREITRSGASIVSLAKRVIEGASSLAEARQILEKNPPLSGWTFFVADAKTREARCFETGGRRIGEVLPENGYLSAANRYRSAVQRGKDLTLSTIWNEHNIAREARLTALGRIHHGKFDAAIIARCLGDQIDETSQKHRAVGPVIATGHNTGSVVFDPESDRLFVSTEGWPANISGAYVGLGLDALFQGRVEHHQTLPANQKGAARLSMEAFLDSMHKLLVVNDVPAAERALDRALANEPAEATFATARAVLRLRRRDAVGAERDVRAALETETWPGRIAFNTVLLGNALDLQRRREEALTAYRSLNRGIDHKLTRAADRYQRRPFSALDAKLLGLEPILAANP